MNLIRLFLIVGLSALFANADIEIENNAESPKIANFDVTYGIAEKDSAAASSFLEFNIGETATLSYSFTNKEDQDVAIVGVGGNVISLENGEIAANITKADIGPLSLAINETTEFQQMVKLNLDEGEYYLLPNIFVTKGEDLMRVGANPSLLRVLPPPMSLFNPQFLFIQLILLSIVGGLSYFFINTRSSAVKPSKGKAAPIKVDESWIPKNHIKN